MSKNGFWERISTPHFFTIIIILLSFLLVITALATFNGTLWTIGGALLTSLISPLLVYLRIWPKHETIAKTVTFFVFLLLNIFIVFYFVQQWATYPIYFPALIEYTFVLILIMSTVVLLYARYQKPKLESHQVLIE